MIKTGIFGGSFNPPHIGHLLIAERVCEEFGLDSILFIPAAVPPHKIGNSELVPNADRVKMLLHAIQFNSRFDVSTMEIDREGVSFTVETLREIARGSPAAELYFLMGADSLAEFHTWREPDEICALADLIVLPREHFTGAPIRAEFKPHVRMAHTPVIGISGTDIRRRVREGRSIQYYVTREVADYIAEHNLYKQ